MRVYERIREYVATHGLEPQAVAVWAGLSRAAFAAMLEGRRRMYAEDVRVICLALGVSADEMLGRTDGAPPAERSGCGRA